MALAIARFAARLVRRPSNTSIGKPPGLCRVSQRNGLLRRLEGASEILFGGGYTARSALQ